jgi:DNA (cytosine-5)-methyltransferase 1
VTLLPTPAVNDMGAGKTVEDWDAWTERMKAAHGNGNGHGKSLAIEAQRLLPTPRATDGTKGGPNQRGSSGDLMLPSAVHHLLPTPTAMDSKASGGSGPSNITLTDAMVRGKTLPTGDSTHPPSTDGPQPWDVPLPLPLSLEPKDNHDSHPDSSNG